MRRLLTISTTLACVVVTGSLGQACSVPVFRYALERWQPGAYQVIVFHEGALAEEHKKSLQILKDVSLEGTTRLANFYVETVNLAGKVRPEMREFYQKLDEANRAKSHPLIVVRYAKAGEIDVPFWSAPLNAKNANAIIDSPARRTIADRIMKGHSVVCILLDNGNASDAEKLLVSEFNKIEKKRNLSKLLPLIFTSTAGLIDSRTGAAPLVATASLGHTDSFQKVTDLVDRLNGPVLPIPIRLSVVRVKRDDPAESFLVSMLLNSEPPFEGQPSLKDLRESMVFPIFGRGRSRYAMVGKGISAENVGGDAQLLTGPCTCTVKNQIKGFDLLIAADWKAAIGETLVQDKENTLPPLIGIGDVKLPTIRDVDPPNAGKSIVTADKLEKMIASLSRMMDLDQQQNPWRELILEMKAAARKGSQAKTIAGKKPIDPNKQASTSTKTIDPPMNTQQPTDTQNQGNDSDTKTKIKKDGTFGFGSPLLRNTLIAVIAGIVIVGAVYIFARRSSPGS